MPVRNAKLTDAQAIRNMLEQLGYPLKLEQINEKLALLLDSANDIVYVYEDDNKVVAFITLHFSIQLAFEGSFCEIGYFVVDSDVRSKGIGRLLEEKACKAAIANGCSQINVFSMIHRADAHRFYQRQGYTQIERFFNKKL